MRWGTAMKPLKSLQVHSPLIKKVKKSLGSFFQTTVAHATWRCCWRVMIPAINGEDDSLAWWNVHKINDPQLCKMALCPCHKCSLGASVQCWGKYKNFSSLMFKTRKSQHAGFPSKKKKSASYLGLNRTYRRCIHIHT